MLLDNFFSVLPITPVDATTWSIQVILNPEHPLYQGHFPEHPIVPGVCMLQIIKECVEYIRRERVQYTQIASCKFLSAINPAETIHLKLTLNLKEDEENGQLLLLTEGQADNTCFIKLKAHLKPLSPPKAQPIQE